MTEISTLASYIASLLAEEAVAQRADDSDHDAALTSERFDTERRILEADPHSANGGASRAAAKIYANEGHFGLIPAVLMPVCRS